MSTLESRNLLAWGEENQKKLNEQRVMVIGSDLLPQYIMAGLSGLSIGELTIMDNANIKNKELNFLCDKESLGQSKCEAIKERLEKINKDMQINTIYSKFCEAMAYKHKPSILIDASNETSTKLKALKFSLDYKIPLISAASNGGKSVVTKYQPNKLKTNNRPSLENLIMEEFDSKKQGTFSSGIAAAHVCEEIRKLSFLYDNLKNDKPLPNNTPLSYCLYSEERKDTKKDGRIPELLKGKKALVVGAGGIGNYVALNLGLMKWGKIDIIDFDQTEEHNLNRQILLYDSIDQYKSKTLANRINELTHNNPAKGIKAKLGKVNDKKWLKKIYEFEKERWYQKNPENDFIGENEFINKYFGLRNEEKRNNIYLLKEEDLKGYDVIFGCLDSKFARLWINRYAVKNNIMYIDGGVSSTSGQVASYIPGKTKCIDCQMSVEKMPPPYDIVSCGENPEGSVVMSNMLIGSLMVGEAINGLYTNNYLKGPIKYFSLNNKRISLLNEKKTKHSC
ncbi:MAG: ThiF family adenylyltransferase [Nanobdellota archaeon]